MSDPSLFAVSPLDGRYRNVTCKLSEYLSESTLIYGRIKLEVKYLVALSNAHVIRELTDTERKYLEEIYEVKETGKLESVKEFENTTKHDVKAIELFIKSKLENTSLKDVTEKLHYCLTSEDINNLAYRLTFKNSLDQVTFPKIEEILNKFVEFIESNKDTKMMARTHGQDAIPTTLGKEIGVFAFRLANVYSKLKSSKLSGKLNGAIGGWSAHVFAEPDLNWQEFSKKFVENLDLEYVGITTQINQFDDIVIILNYLHLFNSILLGFNQDIWRYISDGWITQKREEGVVGSSTMAQKINPIFFENSEGNINVVNGIIEALVRSLPVSRMQRDLSNSTVIRNLSTILAHEQIILSSTLLGLSKISPNIIEINEYLNSNWSVLAEALQILLRKNNVPDSYNLVKNLTMGEKTSKEEWFKLISKLNLDPDLEKKAKEISLDSYTGLCVEIAEEALQKVKDILIINNKK